MQCPRCQHENREGRRFCSKCGALLTAVCSSCGFTNEPGDEFCGGCGARLGALQPAQAKFTSPDTYTPKHLAEKILTSKAALEGERKQVTVLFADLKGSMELLADRDPEEARKLLDPVLERMMEAVHRYEGTVNQVMGDGIMALFGAPLAHEDHAVRACYAALRMQDAVRRYADGARRDAGVTIQIRVGLNSGEVVVRSIGSDLRMDYTAVGQTTHLAARMEQLATPGSIVITADSLRLAEGFVEVISLGPVNVKGLSQPLEAWEVTGVGAVRTRLQAAASRGLTRFVGRDAELDLLRRTLERARGGQGQMVAIVGEPGVGKSRLFHEFTHSYRLHEWLVLDSGSVSYGKATTYLPVIDLLKAYLKVDGRDDTRAIRSKVTGTLLTLDESLRDVVPPVLALLEALPEGSPFLTLDPSQRRQQTLDGLKRLVLRESQVQPLLLVFEDLHWMDSETQAFLDNLVESVPAARLLLLVNYRPEYQHDWGSKTYYNQLRIDPLPPESADELLRVLLGIDPALQSLKRLLIERTEGNPFFLEECVRTLVETGTFAGTPGAYRLVQPLAGIQVPATVQAMLAARIDRLPPEEKQLLQSAAIIGKDVPFALLQAIVDAPVDDLRRSLLRLTAAEFLYETRMFPDLEYTFKHALTHDVAYGSVLQERRRGLHGRIAAAIETVYADRLVEHVERLAHHAFQSEAWAKAVGYLREAGAKALGRSVHREAAACFEQALVALGHLPETRSTIELGIDLRFDLRVAVAPVGSSLAYVLERMRQAEASAVALDDKPRLARASAYMVESLWILGDHARAIESGQRALPIAEELGDVGLQALTRRYLGGVYHTLGEYLRAIDLFRQSLAPLQGDLIRGYFSAPLLTSVGSRTVLAWCLAELGEFVEGLAVVGEAVRIAESVAQPLSLVNAYWGRGLVHICRGEFEKAVASLERSLALVQSWSISGWFNRVASPLGQAYALAGRGDDALPLLEQAIQEASARGRVSGHSLYIVRLGQAYLLAGRPEDGLAAARCALQLSRDHRERGYEAVALGLLADIAARRDLPDPDQADHYYREALARAGELGMRPLVAHCHLGLGKLYQRTGQREQAQEHLTTATTMYREMDMRFYLEQAEAAIREAAG